MPTKLHCELGKAFFSSHRCPSAYPTLGAHSTESLMPSSTISSLAASSSSIYKIFLIHKSTWAEHLQVLQEVLTCVQRYRLLLQWKKWRWGSMRLHFLEYIISFDGIQMDLEKTEAILKFPCPTIVKQLQRFLDLLTFSLHFIPRLAREGDLFLVDIPVSSLWHGRLGHLSKAGITHLSSAGYITKLSFSDHQFCEHCQNGKQVAASHLTSAPRESSPLDLVHSDVYGPMPH